MQENLPSDNPIVNPTENPNARHSLGVERSLSDRILAYAFGASFLINVGWIAWVAHSDIFASGAVPVARETQIKVFKRPPPPKPKPKIKPPPPPPPPKQQPHVKPPPLHIPHVTPPRPQPQTHVVPVHTSFRSASNLVMPPAPPAPPTPTIPYNPGPVTTPPALPAPPTPIAPPAPPPPAPPAPPVPVTPPPPPPPPRLPPPPPPRPKNWVPIEMQEASYPDGLGGDVGIDGIDAGEIKNSKVVISFTIDETGHFRNVHVKESSGSTELDNRFLEAIRRGHGTPAVQDHIPHDAVESISFNVGG